MRFLAGVGAALLLSCAVSSAPAAVEYTIQAIPSPPGGNAPSPYAINSSGQVVGFFNKGGNNHAFLYSAGVSQDLGTLGGTIDAVQYGKGPDAKIETEGWYVRNPLTWSPALSPNWGGFAFNYWEPNGWHGAGRWWRDIRGTNIPGAANHVFPSLDHSSIHVNAPILDSLEQDVDNVFGMLGF